MRPQTTVFLILSGLLTWGCASTPQPTRSLPTEPDYGLVPEEAPDSILWPALEAEEIPTDETLLAKILRGHPPLAQMQALYTNGAAAYLDGSLDLAEESFFLLRESLDAAFEADAPTDSLSALYLNSLERKLERFVDILTEERFFADSYAPIEQTLTAAFDSLRTQVGIPEFLVTSAEEEGTNLERELLLLDNEHVQKWMKYFTESTSGRRSFQTWLDRRAAIGHILEDILEEEGLPRELIFLSMIESGLQPSIRSRASAVGYWQFMSSTARNRGLTVNDWVDERRDIEKSTRAACRHLQMLHGMFGQWSLALAAYNAGEYRIQRAIGLQGDPDYWSLRLPRETREYVPKFIAAARIGSDPTAFGFAINEAELLSYDVVELDDAYSLEQLAKVNGVSERQLRELNPQLLASCTPPQVEGYRLRVPSGTGAAVAAAAAAIPQDERMSWRKHRLATGETLGALARRYQTTVDAIMELNGISNARRVRAGRVLTIPYPRGVEVADATGRSGSPAAGGNTYVVRRGDTLTQIARKFDTTVNALRGANGIEDHHINVGQTLRLPGGPGTDSRPLPTTDTHDQTRYRILRGDTLTAIAGRFNVSVGDLLAWNSLPRNGRIRAGEELRIWKARSATTR